jgi:RNA polymerase subunit RPABC4/transcription elongation factor Spt4
MALIVCPECKKEVSDTARRCPNCGKIIARNSWDQIRGCLIVVIILFGAMMVFSMIGAALK